jgi:NADH-quinone oxidoreductase subunit C
MIDTVLATLPIHYLAKCDVAKTGLEWSVFLGPDDILAAAKLLYDAQYSLEDITAIDAKEGYLVVYHFDLMEKGGRAALRVLIPREKAEISSIASVFQGAEWHERETTDFYGIVFAGNPNPVALLLAPEMTEHPLQKADTARAALADIIPPGEVVRSAPEFALLTKPESGAAAGA